MFFGLLNKKPTRLENARLELEARIDLLVFEVNMAQMGDRTHKVNVEWAALARAMEEHEGFISNENGVAQLEVDKVLITSYIDNGVTMITAKSLV